MRIRALIVSLSLLAAWPAATLAAAVASHQPLPGQTITEDYTVVIGGNTVGKVVVQIAAAAGSDADQTEAGSDIRIEYDVKNNGRGPTIAELLQLDPQGLPTRWRITGSTTFGSKVEEWFETESGTPSWRDATGEAQAAATDSAVQAQLYIAQNTSPWALGLYARQLLAQPSLTLPVLPSGNVRLEKGAELEVSDGKSTLKVRQYALSGLDLDPSHLLLDEQQNLFAVISPRSVVIRKGFEGEQQRLRDLATELGKQRFEAIQAQTARRFTAPVRINNVRVFDPHTLSLSAPQQVIWQGRRISSLQPLGSPASPGEVQIDAEGGTLVAGMYEMHAHTGQDGALLNIAAGVTSMRDMGNDNEVLATLIDNIEKGAIAGPRIVRSGFIEGRSPYNSNNGILVSSQEQALDAVRWYAARGFVQVKLYNSMNPKWTTAAVAEAHRLGLRAAGHVPAFANADAMIDAGYDELTHINQIMLGWVLQADEDTRTLLRLTALKRLQELDLASAPVQATLDRIVEKKVAVEPTIAIHERLLLHTGKGVPLGLTDVIEHMPVGYQRSARQAWSDMSAPGDEQAYAAAYQRMMQTLTQMRERGVLLIPGTDLGGSFAFHRELELFEELGYSRAEVLRLATLDMARYLGQDQSLGSIEAGKLADFFLIAGDPTADLRAIKQIRLVVKDGTVYLPQDIYPHFGIRPFAQAPKIVEADRL